MSEEHKKSFWPWIVALLIGVLPLYLTSFGPACNLCDKGYVSGTTLWRIYRPVALGFCYLPLSARSRFEGFVNAFRTAKNNLFVTPEPLWREWEYQGFDHPTE